MRKWLSLALLALILNGRAAQAQGMEAPADVQVPLLFKILTFDRKLADRVPGDDIVIAILFQAEYHPSMRARDQVVEALTDMLGSTISGHPVRWVLLELRDAASLRSALKRSQVAVIYVTPFRGLDLRFITEVARAEGITTFTGVPTYVEEGLALGIGIDDERPQIIVNISAARAEGSDFTSQLLRVSRVVEH
ncbi:MAG TPA: YfiR family protein [Gemmatimonadales bacterium]|jgi:hypothetical protein|nr:YfiR family protein [Gemmatimonadales bacterium]